MLDPVKITKAAQTHFGKYGLLILPENHKNPEKQLIAQSELFVETLWNELDTETFVINKSFLNEIERSAPDDDTVKVLLTLNESAFRVLDKDECQYLEQQALNPDMPQGRIHHTLADVYDWDNKTDQVIDQLQKHILVTNTGTLFKRLQETFKEAGKSKAELRLFTEQCATKGLILPGASGQMLIL